MANIEADLGRLDLHLSATRSRVTRLHWMEWIKGEIGLEPGSSGFDSRFATHLAGIMRGCGYPHIAAAILGASADVERDGTDRTEFDGLIDLALQLIVLDTEI